MVLTYDSWDVSTLQDESIMAVLKKSDKDNTKYVLEFLGKGEMQDFETKSPWDGESTCIYELIVNDGITNIGANACRCLKIKKLQLPSSVMSIGDNSFEFSFELETANLGNGIKRIKKFDFNSCAKLTSVYGCTNLLCIEELGFKSCARLEDVDYGTTCQADEHAFSYCNNLKKNQGSKVFDIDKFKNKINNDFKLER